MDGVAGMMTVVSAVAAGNDVEAPVTLLRLEVGEKFLSLDFSNTTGASGLRI